MNASTPPSPHVAAPGTEKPRRFRPKLRYELIGCGLHGHEILGTDATALRPEDELFARESGGPLTTSKHGIVHDLQYLFAVSIRNLYLVGAAIAAYALLEGIEAIGLWFAKRWAEYLTFVATIVLIPYEINELIKGITALKVLAFIINVAVAVYLLYAKRLFGVRGGGRAEQAEREADTGRTASERATPKSTPQPL